MTGKRWLHLLRASLVAWMLLWGTSASAHPLDKASLSLVEVAEGRFEVQFRSGSPTLERQLEMPARFPEHCRYSERMLDCGPRGLVGRIEFAWLKGSLTRLMVSIDWRDGSRLLRVATASSAELSVYGSPGGGLAGYLPVVSDYARLGVEHILGGFDHLFFVLALALLVRRGRMLAATVTAFTLAHSVTLALTVLGWVVLPAPPVEAMIALSIVLLCAECLRPADSLTRRAPWLVAFTFGLLHGFGFASALLDIGLPPRHLSWALLSFNLGVEVGQLGVIGLFLACRLLWSRMRAPPWSSRVLVYAMGSVAAFWTVDRVLAVLVG